jgi:hypothetical protein
MQNRWSWWMQNPSTRVTLIDERTKRLAANEAVFRTVNEKLEDLNEAFSFATSTFSIVCECGDIACVEQIEISEEQYAELRSDPTHFAIVPSHEADGIEELIESRAGYVIVRKREGLPARLARETSP